MEDKHLNKFSNKDLSKFYFYVVVQYITTHMTHPSVHSILIQKMRNRK